MASTLTVKDVIKENKDFIVNSTIRHTSLFTTALQRDLISIDQLRTIERKALAESEQLVQFMSILSSKEDATISSFIDLFQSTGNIHVSHRLQVVVAKLSRQVQNEKTENGASRMNRSLWFKVTDRGKTFVPFLYEKQLTSLSELLERGEVLVVVVEGKDNYGKGDMLRHFAKETLKREDGHCAWINCRDEEDMLVSLFALSKTLNIPVTVETGFHDIVQQVLAAIGSLPNRKMVVFSNVSQNSRLLGWSLELNKSDKLLIVLTTNESLSMVVDHTRICVSDVSSMDATIFLNIVLELKTAKEYKAAMEISAKCNGDMFKLRQAVVFITAVQREVNLSKLQALELYKNLFVPSDIPNSSAQHIPV